MSFIGLGFIIISLGVILSNRKFENKKARLGLFIIGSFIGLLGSSILFFAIWFWLTGEKISLP